MIFDETLLKLGNKFKFNYKNNVFDVISIVKLTSIQMYPDVYYKFRFTNPDYAMFYIPSQNEAYISYGHIDTSNISEELIGEPTIKFMNEEFNLELFDHQLVIEMLYGMPLEAEGECRFYDYYNLDRSKNLSFGYTFRKQDPNNGKNFVEKSDYLSYKINIDDIEII